MGDEKHSTQWPDIITAIASIVTVILFLSEKSYASILLYVILFLVLTLLLRGQITKKYLTSRLLLRQRKALKKFESEFNRLVSEASAFMQATQSYSIPYYLRSCPEIRNIRPSDDIENLFSTLSFRLDARVKNKYKTFSDFDEANRDLFEYLNAYHRIYVESFLRALNGAEKTNILTPAQKGEINNRLNLFRNYTQEYNSYRKELNGCLGKKVEEYLLLISTESVN